MPETYAPTPFTEANALLAAQEDNTEAVKAILADMLDGELARLELACGRLGYYCRRARSEREAT